MKIGILKEGKNPPDERVPLAPKQCKLINEKYPNIELFVQKSEVRRFKDAEYLESGIKLVDDVSDCDVLLSVKEVPIPMLVKGKMHFFFSHTIKKQPYNRDLLQAIIQKKIQLVDWECLVKSNGQRVIGFGRYAGIVGAYNTLRAWGLKHNSFELKPAYMCDDFEEVKNELKKISPFKMKIVITGGGRVAKGIMEVLDLLKVPKISPQDFLKKVESSWVYTQLSGIEYAKRKNGTSATLKDYYKEPETFESDFYKYARVADVYISGHFWDSKAPFIISKSDFQKGTNLKVVGDISCDIAGPIACTLRPSTIKDPIYGYNPNSGAEADFYIKENIAVMAVDNLPCELPKDASIDFGNEIIKHVLPALIEGKDQELIDRGSITKDGSLTERFAYLKDYLEGK